MEDRPKPARHRPRLSSQAEARPSPSASLIAGRSPPVTVRESPLCKKHRREHLLCEVAIPWHLSAVALTKLGWDSVFTDFSNAAYVQKKLGVSSEPSLSGELTFRIWREGAPRPFFSPATFPSSASAREATYEAKTSAE